MKGEMMINCRR